MLQANSALSILVWVQIRKKSFCQIEVEGHSPTDCGSTRCRGRPLVDRSSATDSTRRGGESVVAISARLVERRFAQHPGHLIIDFSTLAPRLMKLPPSVLKV
jgi:hypothetical protein